jgi:hypothetical protein
MTLLKYWLSDYQEDGSSGLEVTIANDEKLSCNGIGNVSVKLNGEDCVTTITSAVT